MSFSTVTEAFTGTPLLNGGPYTMEVRVTDSSGIQSIMDDFIVTLLPNAPPVYTLLND